MIRKAADPDCILCHGNGFHSPIVAWPAVSDLEDKKRRANLPDCQECGCTFDWNAPPQYEAEVMGEKTSCECGRESGKCIRGDLDECPLWHEEIEDDEDDGFDEMACGQNSEGGCDLAGTEWCDWECPFSSEMYRRREKIPKAMPLSPTT